MDLKLLQQLREAGFGTDELWDERHPTLSELISACGNNLKQINNHQDSRFGKKRWTAKSRENEMGKKLPKYKDYEGKNPEIAVAKLWLALNKK